MTPTLDLAACATATWQATPDLGLRVALMAGLLLLAGWAGAQRFFPGQRVFVVLQVVMVTWLAASSAEHAAVQAGCKATLALLSWPAMLAQPMLWAVFLDRYVHSRLRPPSARATLAVALPLLLLTVAALGNGWHGLLYGPQTTLGPPLLGLPRMHYEYGPLFVLNAVWAYGWLLAGLGLVLHAWRHAPARDSQWLVFLLIMAVPWVANVIYLGLGWRLLGGDPTPLGFAAALFGFAWLIRRQQFFKVLPLARRLLFTELPDPVLVLDAQGRVMDANTAATQLAGRAMPGARPLAEWPRFGAALAAVLDDPAQGPLTLVDPPVVLELRVRDIGEGEHHVGRLLQLRDVTERQRMQARLVKTLAERNAQLQQVATLQAELREQALHDPLTGLYNRRALAQRFDAEATRWRGTGRPLALALLDIDHFKRINDTRGHAAGDVVLRELGGSLRAGLRAGDTLFRIGGEEFAVLLPGADAAQAAQRLDAIRTQLAALPADEPVAGVSFSAGVAAYGPHGRTLDELMRAADLALYRAKDEGRNRVRVAQPG